MKKLFVAWVIFLLLLLALGCLAWRQGMEGKKPPSPRQAYRAAAHQAGAGR